MCSKGLFKTFLIVFNIVFLAFGGTCLGVGIWVLVDNSYLIQLTRISSNYVDLSSLNVLSLIESAAIILIVGGGIVFLIAFFGFCGAVKQNKMCLYIYAITVTVIILIELTAGILAAVYSDLFEQHATNFLNATLQARYVGPYDYSDVISLAFDSANIFLGCCGISSGLDYSYSSQWNTSWVFPTNGSTDTAQIPVSCCIFSDTSKFPTDFTGLLSSIQDESCPVLATDSYYTTGCVDRLKTKFSEYFYVVLAIGISVAVLQTWLVICALCLAKKGDEVEDIKKGKS